MDDPTYNKKEVENNPVWHIAWVMCQIRDDVAPLGWGQYITTAECLLDNFDIKPKKAKKK